MTARGDLHGAFKEIRLLGAKARRPLKAVRLSDGTLASSTQQNDDIWQEHFCSVTAGALVDDIAFLRRASVVPTIQDSVVDFSPQRVWAAISALSRHKGVGPDSVPSELLQAG